LRAVGALTQAGRSRRRGAWASESKRPTPNVQRPTLNETAREKSVPLQRLASVFVVFLCRAIGQTRHPFRR
jgi:hypothetical protein